MTPELFKLINSLPEVKDAMARAVVTMNAAARKLPATKEHDRVVQQLDDSMTQLAALLNSSGIDEVCKMYHPKND